MQNAPNIAFSETTYLVDELGSLDAGSLAEIGVKSLSIVRKPKLNLASH